MRDNELIAEFMGYEGQFEDWCGDNVLVDDQFSDTGKSMVTYDPDKSWNWLMPVVHKILKTTSPEKGGQSHEYLELEKTRVGNSIEYVYMVVVRYVKWHKINKDRKTDFSYNELGDIIENNV